MSERLWQPIWGEKRGRQRGRGGRGHSHRAQTTPQLTYPGLSLQQCDPDTTYLPQLAQSLALHHCWCPPIFTPLYTPYLQAVRSQNLF